LPKGGHAVSVSKGLDRDRAVDECGNQIAVFGRIGARPFNLQEQRKLYFRDGAVWRVSDDPGNPIYRLALPPPQAPQPNQRRRRKRLRASKLQRGCPQIGEPGA